jgi:uncharacterized membrane protein YjgN (DUF898 family)
MFCSICGNEIQDQDASCPKCGHAVGGTGGAPAMAQIRFEGTGLQLLGWILLAIPAFVLVIPAAWMIAAMARWFCRNLRFGDDVLFGTTASFRGKGGEVLGWAVLNVLVAIANIACNFALEKAGFPATLLVSIGFACVQCAISLQILKWLCSRVDLSAGPPLRFAGEYGGYLGWTILVGLSIYTIIGWAWAEAGMFRWMCRNIHGDGLRFAWLGKGHQLLWRGLVAVLVSCLIIPLPWMMMWLMRWQVEQARMERTAAA